jgi:acetoacetyl-CoA synthetase
MFPSPEFFPGARLNFAGSILSNRNSLATAILEVPEGSLEARETTWGQLYVKVEEVADAMRSSGVSKGDRVAALIANTEQAIIFCLAALSIGAIWSSISPEFGAQGILDRLVQVEPKLIFADTSVKYNGKQRNLLTTIKNIAKVLTQNKSLVNIVFTTLDQEKTELVPKGINMRTFISRGEGRKLTFEQLPFNHPAFIFYSSGTVLTLSLLL